MLYDHCNMNHRQMKSIKLCSYYSLRILWYVLLPLEQDQTGRVDSKLFERCFLLKSLVSAVRKCNINQQLFVERNMICLSFAYDYQNYARYNICLKVYLFHL